MASSTSLWAFPYPTESDLITNGPGVFANLADGLDGNVRGGVACSVPMFSHGALSARPAASTGAGLLYLASDTTPSPVLYVSDGTNWQSLTTQGGPSPLGAIHQFGGTTDPVDSDGGARWMICDGRSISTTTYASLFTLFKYTYGGSGSTFKIPDLRSRVAVGADAGGTQGSAGRITSNNTLGAVAGETTHTLISAEMPVHTHTVSDPGHVHGISDPGHAHGVADPGHAHGVYDPGHGHSISGGVPIYNTNYGGNGITTGAGSPANFNYPRQALGADGAGTNIGIYGSGTGIGIYGSGTGVSVQSHTTGISNANAGGGGAHNNLQPYQVVNHIVRVL
jgi:microcystin-dependent protein